MAPKWIRGTLVCAYQLSITLGLLGASIVNILTQGIPHAAAYRIPMGLQFTWACVLVLGLLMLPETPRYLVRRGYKEAAALSLSRLRRLDITHPALVEELEEIIANNEYELSLGGDTYKQAFVGEPRLGKRTLTGCGLQMLQQLSGVNFIMYYGTSFFKHASVNDPFLISLVINIVNVFSTLPGLLVIESWGRRKLLIIGAIGMAVCQLLIATFATAGGEDMSLAMNWVLLVFVGIYIFFFAASWGPVTWVVTSEIYPLKIRAKAMSMSTASNWLLNFGIAYGTPYMVGTGPGSANLGPKIFFVWGSFCVVALAFVWFFVYETSKISLEQIDELYERVDRAWHSKEFQPAWSFQQMRDMGWSESGVPPEHELQPPQQPSSNSTSQHPPHPPPPPSSAGESVITILSTSPTETGAGLNGTSGTSTSTLTSTDDAKLLSQMRPVDFSY